MNYFYLLAQKRPEECCCHCGGSGVSFPAPKPFKRPNRHRSAERTLASRTAAEDGAAGYKAALQHDLQDIDGVTPVKSTGADDL